MANLRSNVITFFFTSVYGQKLVIMVCDGINTSLICWDLSLMETMDWLIDWYGAGGTGFLRLFFPWTESSDWRKRGPYQFQRIIYTVIQRRIIFVVTPLKTGKKSTKEKLNYQIQIQKQWVFTIATPYFSWQSYPIKIDQNYAKYFRSDIEIF